MRKIIMLFLFILFSLSPFYAEKRAYNFNLQEISGKTYRLSDYKGKIVVVNFFATWCRFCRMEIRELVSLASDSKYKDKVQIFSISVDENPHHVLPKFIRDLKINYPVLIASEDVISAYGGLTEGIPYTILIDNNGIIVNSYLGARRKGVFENDIRKLLK